MVVIICFFLQKALDVGMAMGGMNPKINPDNYSLFNERTSYGYQP